MTVITKVVGWTQFTKCVLSNQYYSADMWGGLFEQLELSELVCRGRALGISLGYISLASLGNIEHAKKFEGSLLNIIVWTQRGCRSAVQ